MGSVFIYNLILALFCLLMETGMIIKNTFDSAECNTLPVLEVSDLLQKTGFREIVF